MYWIHASFLEGSGQSQPALCVSIGNTAITISKCCNWCNC